jgi:hypothetical protein
MNVRPPPMKRGSKSRENNARRQAAKQKSAFYE